MPLHDGYMISKKLQIIKTTPNIRIICFQEKYLQENNLLLHETKVKKNSVSILGMK